MYNSVVLSALVGAASVAARDIPSNVQSFYDSVKAKGACSNKLATGFYSKDDGPNSEPTTHPLFCCPSLTSTCSLLLLR
jgi:hypothetical protein